MTTEITETVARPRGRMQSNLASMAKRQEVGLVGLLIVLAVVINSINDRFLTTTNIYNLLQTVTVIGIIAVGMTFVLIAKEIDLSVGAVLALSAVTAGSLYASGVTPWLAVAGGIGAGALSGLVVGAVVVFGRVSSFIVTLGMLSIARGLTLLITGGLPQQMPDTLSFIGQGRVLGGLPVSVLIFVLLVLVGQFVLTRTVFGLRVVSVGDNATAARLGGIPVARTRILTFVLIGALAGVAGIVFSTQVGVAEAQAGTGYELDVIAAAVIGGVVVARSSGPSWVPACSACCATPSSCWGCPRSCSSSASAW